MRFESVLIIPNVLCGTIGGQMIESRNGEGRFVPPKTAGPRPPNTMLGTRRFV